MKNKLYIPDFRLFKPRLFVSLLSFLFLIGHAFPGFSQTSSSIEVKGSCADSVVVVSPVTFQLNLYHHDQIVGGNGPCYNIVWPVIMMVPKYRLQKLNESNGTWEWVGSEQNSRTFTGLGSNLAYYRVMARVPVEVENISCEGGKEIVVDVGGNIIGFRGLYQNLPPSNVVIVGQPTANDNKFKFVDGNGINIFGDPSWPIFDQYEDWKIDVSESKYYNQWWLAMFKYVEEGPNLPWAVYQGGWQLNGPPSDPLIPIADWWKNDAGYTFDPGGTYTVQWVATNKDCASWNVNQRDALICPVGFNCKIGFAHEGLEEQIELYPNPASDYFKLSNSQIVGRVDLIDVLGRNQGSWPANQMQYDVSHLPTGTYYVQFFDKTNRFLKAAQIQVMR